MFRFTIKNPNGCCRLCTAKDEEGHMITCIECDRWFHLTCVNIAYTLEGQWFCLKCWDIACIKKEIMLANIFGNNEQAKKSFIKWNNKRFEKSMVELVLRQISARKNEAAKQEQDTRLETTSDINTKASNLNIDAERSTQQSGVSTTQASMESSRSDSKTETLAPSASDSSIKVPTECKSPKVMLGQTRKVPRKGPDKNGIMTREVNEAVSSKQRKNNEKLKKRNETLSKAEKIIKPTLVNEKGSKETAPDKASQAPEQEGAGNNSATEAKTVVEWKNKEPTSTKGNISRKENLVEAAITGDNIVTHKERSTTTVMIKKAEDTIAHEYRMTTSYQTMKKNNIAEVKKHKKEVTTPPSQMKANAADNGKQAISGKPPEPNPKHEWANTIAIEFVAAPIAGQHDDFKSEPMTDIEIPYREMCVKKRRNKNKKAKIQPANKRLIKTEVSIEESNYLKTGESVAAPTAEVNKTDEQPLIIKAPQLAEMKEVPKGENGLIESQDKLKVDEIRAPNEVQIGIDKTEFYHESTYTDYEMKASSSSFSRMKETRATEPKQIEELMNQPELIILKGNKSGAQANELNAAEDTERDCEISKPESSLSEVNASEEIGAEMQHEELLKIHVDVRAENRMKKSELKLLNETQSQSVHSEVLVVPKNGLKMKSKNLARRVGIIKTCFKLRKRLSETRTRSILKAVPYLWDRWKRKDVISKIDSSILKDSLRSQSTTVIEQASMNIYKIGKEKSILKTKNDKLEAPWSNKISSTMNKMKPPEKRRIDEAIGNVCNNADESSTDWNEIEEDNPHKTIILSKSTSNLKLPIGKDQIKEVLENVNPLDSTINGKHIKPTTGMLTVKIITVSILLSFGNPVRMKLEEENGLAFRLSNTCLMKKGIWPYSIGINIHPYVPIKRKIKDPKQEAFENQWKRKYHSKFKRIATMSAKGIDTPKILEDSYRGKANHYEQSETKQTMNRVAKKPRIRNESRKIEIHGEATYRCFIRNTRQLKEHHSDNHQKKSANREADKRTKQAASESDELRTEGSHTNYTIGHSDPVYPHLHHYHRRRRKLLNERAIMMIKENSKQHHQSNMTTVRMSELIDRANPK